MRIAALGFRTTISGWAAILLSPRTTHIARPRGHRRLDYPSPLGLDHVKVGELYCVAVTAVSKNGTGSDCSAAASVQPAARVTPASNVRSPGRQPRVPATAGPRSMWHNEPVGTN